MLHVQTSSGTHLLIDTLYVKRLTADEGAALEAAGQTANTVTTDQLKALITAVGVTSGIPGGTFPVYAAPLTVQGASEDYITDRMLQVQNRDDLNANALNVAIFNSKNEILAKLDA